MLQYGTVLLLARRHHYYGLKYCTTLEYEIDEFMLLAENLPPCLLEKG